MINIIIIFKTLYIRTSITDFIYEIKRSGIYTDLFVRFEF